METAKKLSHLPKDKLFIFSKFTAGISTAIIFVGGLGLILKRGAWNIGIITFGIASLITSGLNIFKAREK